MSTYATRRLCASGCENTERRAEECKKKLTRRQNVEKEKHASMLRSFDTEARHRDAMTRHWDLHRQNLTTVQDKYMQYNLMWASRDDLYRQRREAAFARRIAKYQHENDLVAQQTDEFLARRDRILDPNAVGGKFQIAGDSAQQQKELLERKLTMSSHSRRNEIELYRYRDQNPTMAVAPPARSMSVPLWPDDAAMRNSQSQRTTETYAADGMYY